MSQSFLAAQAAAGLVAFYDDRSKSPDILTATQVLYEDAEIALVTAKFLPAPATYKVLFRKSSGEVLTTEFNFWYAQYREAAAAPAQALAA